MRRVLAFVLLVICAAAAQDAAQKAPPPYRLFNLVTDESIVAKLNQYGADGYRFVAATEAAGGGRVYLMERVEGGPFEYAPISKPLYKGEFYTEINALAERGFRFVPGTFGTDPMRSLFKAPTSHGLVEKTAGSKKYQYTFVSPMSFKNFWKDLANVRAQGFVPVVAIKEDGLHIAMLEREQGTTVADKVDPDLYRTIELSDIKQRTTKLLPPTADGYRIISVDFAPRRNAPSELFAWTEKAANKPDYKMVGTDVKIDKKTIIDVVAAQNADIEKQLNEAGASGYRLVVPPLAQVHFTGFATMWRDVFAVLEKAETAYEYKLVIEEDTPALSRKLATLHDQGFHVVRNGLLSGDTALVERPVQVVAEGK